MSRNIDFVFFYPLIFLLASFQNRGAVDCLGTYTLTERTPDHVKILHKIELQSDNTCNWYVLTKRSGNKEKCRKLGYYAVSGNEIKMTWSRNQCSDCGTNANLYDELCPVETMEIKEGALWTTDEPLKKFTKIK